MNWEEAALMKQDPGTYRGAVVGVSFVPGYPDNLHTLLEVLIEDGEPLEASIQRAPENQYDSNACEVWVGNHFIGHLAKDLAAEIAPLIDDGAVADIHIVSIGFANQDANKPGASFYLKLI